MPAKTRYFICLPASPEAGIRGGYYPVDPATLDKSVLSQIYRRDDRSGRYVRAYGVQPNLGPGFDASDLQAHLLSVLEQICSVLPDSGLASDFAAKLHQAMANLSPLIGLVAAGQLDEATRVIDTLGEGLLSLAATACDNLTMLEAQASGQAHGDADAAASLQAGLYLATAESLAESIDEALRAYHELRAFDADLSDLLATVEPITQAWSAPATDPWMQEQLTWLGDEDGFCRQASRFLIRRDPSVVDLMVTVIAQARQRLAAISTRLASAQSQLDEVKAKAETVLVREFNVDSRLRVIREARKSVAKLAQVDIADLIRGLITSEEFSEWQSLLADPEWLSPHAASIRLRDKAATLRQLLDQVPTLADADQRIIDQVEGYIVRVESAMADLGRPAPAPQAAPTVPARSAPSTTPPGARIDRARLEELYELMTAVGAVKYCGSANLTGGTPRAMLDLLEALGRITPAEREIYSGPLRERLAADSRVVGEHENRLELWRTTNPAQFRWIQFRQGRGRSTVKFALWRLVEQARQSGLALCAVHSLDPDDIVAAYEARRDARAAARQHFDH